jgi:hypothetical protein
MNVETAENMTVTDSRRSSMRHGRVCKTRPLMAQGRYKRSRGCLSRGGVVGSKCHQRNWSLDHLPRHPDYRIRYLWPEDVEKLRKNGNIVENEVEILSVSARIQPEHAFGNHVPISFDVIKNLSSSLPIGFLLHSRSPMGSWSENLGKLQAMDHVVWSSGF